MNEKTAFYDSSNVKHKQVFHQSKKNTLPRYRRPIRSDYKHWLNYHLPDLNPSDISTMEELEALL